MIVKAANQCATDVLETVAYGHNNMTTDLQRQAAQTPCSETWTTLINEDNLEREPAKKHPHDCPCQGTGLKYAMLSRGCYTIHSFLDNAPPCPECGGTRENPGRIPDVTPEKMLRFGVCLWYDADTFESPTFVATHRNDPTNPFFGDTPEDAACAALLGTL